MEVTMRLALRKEEYYEYLIDALWGELKRSVSRKIRKSEIKTNYKFINKYKHADKCYEVISEISRLEKNRLYELSRKGDFGSQLISYRLDDNHDGTINVTYSQVTKNNTVFRKLNSTIKQSKEKRMMKQMLKQIENEIILKRID